MNVSSLSAVASFLPPQVQREERHGYFVAGTGTPVLMLHSSLSSKSQWTTLAERMASRFKVIAVDLCGYGDNALPKAEASFTLDDEVALVTARLHRLVNASESVHVVGHSYGALVALRLAHCLRGRIASLALFEPVAFSVLEEKEPALKDLWQIAEGVSRSLVSGHRHDAARSFVDFWSGEGSYASMPLPAQASLARRVDKVPFDFRAVRGWPEDARDLRVSAVPTLLLSGSRSPAVVQLIHALLARTLPNVRTGSFDCGHMGPVTHPHLINPWIEAFVDMCCERDATIAPRAGAVPSLRAAD
ncbi:MAG TPA: alpha/beta hydrolase [Casimicrobiaceae bacterium]|nr:alpha/beta hydrolase [Casimicrobiaceae bacterium]